MNLSHDVITEKQISQFYVLVLNVYVAWFYKGRRLLTVFSQLRGLRAEPGIHSDALLCTQMIGFPSREDVQRSRNRKRGGKRSMRASEEARVTPSHPAVTLHVGLSPYAIPRTHSFIIPPLLASRVWFSDCET